jgi:hypothetical protein
LKRAPGDPGSKGEQGIKGATATPGADGMDGKVGLPGAAGPKEPPGLPGATRKTGSSGAPGNNGPTREPVKHKGYPEQPVSMDYLVWNDRKVNLAYPESKETQLQLELLVSLDPPVKIV